MDSKQGMKQLDQTRTIAIIRGLDRNHLIPTAEGLLAGGISVVEITMNTAGAAAMISELQSRLGDRMFIGAGTVLDLEGAQTALEAGARFLVTPNTDEEVISFAAEQGIPIYPGAMTPTEIVRAWKAGATAIKLFPTGSLGLSYIKELQGPLSHIPMLAVGGVDEHNVGEFLQAGCYGVGIGSRLFNRSEIERGNYASVTDKAARLIRAIQEHLASSGR